MRCLALVLAASLAFADDGLNPAYVARRDKEVAGAVKDLLALGKWGREQKLIASARRAYEAAALLTPDDAEAQEGLRILDPTAPVQEPAAAVKAFEAKRLQVVKTHAKAFTDIAAWAAKARLAAEAEEAKALSKKLDVPPEGNLSTAERTILNDINRHRAAAGCVLVKIDHALSDASDKHAKYLVTNTGHPSTEGLGAHKEDPSLPGYTAEGQRAGGASDICFQAPEGSVDGWVATLYHRIPVLHPRLRRTGCGFAQGGKWGWVGVLDVIEGHDDVPCDPDLVRYPARSQKGVPLAFGGEMPDPVPGGSQGCGYPVTLTYYDGSKVTGVTATLKAAGGADVAFHLSTPDKPATDFDQQDTICLIPKATLAGGATYEVEIRLTRNGKPAVEAWKFTTK